MTTRRRLDTEMVRRGLAETRSEAARLIDAGAVLVAGAPATKAARLVAPSEALALAGSPPPFVSRAGEKLAAALDRFGIEPDGRRALDAGASTGGFTDCLLQRGASSVLAVDVGHGQLHERLRRDPRVTVRERTDIRSLGPVDPFPLVVADLSFISLRSVAGNLLGAASPESDLLVLVKPQFEVGRAAVSRGRGVIRDPQLWQQALEGAGVAFSSLGAVMMGAMASPLPGAEGNVEFFLHLRPGSVGASVRDPAALLRQAVAEGRSLSTDGQGA